METTGTRWKRPRTHSRPDSANARGCVAPVRVAGLQPCRRKKCRRSICQWANSLRQIARCRRAHKRCSLRDFVSSSAQPRHRITTRRPAMGVKLRVRVAGVTAPPRALEVPETCTLAQLRQKIAAKVLVDLPGWGPGVAESDVEVSLNGDEDLGAAGHDESATLRACGVTRGDLIRVKRRDESGGDTSTAGGHASAAGNVTAANASQRMPTRVENVVSTRTSRTATAMELGTDDEPPSTRTESDAEEERRLSLPSALRRALERLETEASSSGRSDDAALLLVATHAALIETGLVRARGAGEEDGDDFSLPAGWLDSASRTGAARVRYALAEAPRGATCEVKAQSPDGSSLVACGVVDARAAAGDGDAAAAFPAHVALLESGDWLRATTHAHSSARSLDSSLVGRFAALRVRGAWSRLKDAFASRLRHDLRLAAGLPSVSGLLALPDDLKVAVLRRVPLGDHETLCAVSAVCREMRFAADADALWSARFEAAFGPEAAARACARRREAATRDGDASGARSPDAYDHAMRWKSAFAEAFVAARREAQRRKRARELAERNAARFAPRFSVPGVPLNPGFGGGALPRGPPGYTPGVTGGDYDLYPGGGLFGSGQAPMPGFPGGGGLGFPGGTPIGGWPVMPGGVPGGVPTPTPGGGLGNGRRGRGGRGGPANPPMPGWDGRPRPPGGPDGDAFL